MLQVLLYIEGLVAIAYCRMCCILKDLLQLYFVGFIVFCTTCCN